MQIKIGSIGVCLADTGQPVKLYIVDTKFICGLMYVLPINKSEPDYDKPRIVESSDFWVLIDST